MTARCLLRMVVVVTPMRTGPVGVLLEAGEGDCRCISR